MEKRTFGIKIDSEWRSDWKWENFYHIFLR
nr:DUF1698 domain-containing protein [Candidatus Pantoea edessiphila]